MAVNPIISLDPDEVIIKWNAPYVSDGLNARLVGYPRGIFKGFDPEVQAGSPAVQLLIKRNVTESLSSAVVRSNLSVRDVAVLLTRDILLDFTGTTVYPVYVKLKAGYKIGQTSSAQIFTDTTPPNGLDEIGICRVRQPGGPGTDIVVDSTDIEVPAFRNTPVASAGQDFGFMPGGAFEDLQDAIALTSEIEDARDDIDTGFTWPDLSARFVQDFATVANRLTRLANVVRGNQHKILAADLPVSSAQVAESFGSLSRTLAPLKRFEDTGAPGIGSGGADGYFTSSPDNIAALVDIQNKRFFTDDDGKVVFARLGSAASVVTSGTSTFTNASAVVSNGGTGDYVADGVTVGMTILGPDGEDYGIIGVTTTQLTLSLAYQDTTAPIASAVVRSITASFFVTDGAGGESSYSFTAGNPTDLDFQLFFTGIESLNTIQRDGTLDLVAALDAIDPVLQVIQAGDASESYQGDGTGTVAKGGSNPHTNYDWISLGDQNFDATIGSIVQNLSADGVFTFRRPPEGYIAYIELVAWGCTSAGSGSPNLSIELHEDDNATVLRRGHFNHSPSGSGGFTNAQVFVKKTIPIDDAISASLPNAFELWHTGNAPDINETFLDLRRTLRKV